MALAVKHFPDIDYRLGQSGIKKIFQLQPGTSDYTTGGYSLTAAQFELGYLAGATICGSNAAGALYEAKPVFPSTSFNQGPNSDTPAPSTTFKLLVELAGVEVANGTNLTTMSWLLEVTGW